MRMFVKFLNTTILKSAIRPMSRIKPAANSFGNLNSESDDEDDNVGEEDEKPGQRPQSPDARFWALYQKQRTDVDSLAETIDNVLRLSAADRVAFKAKFDQYDSMPPTQYREEVRKRLNCFSKCEKDFLNMVKGEARKVNARPEDLFAKAVEALGPAKPKNGHGYLLLIDLLADSKTKVPVLQHQYVGPAGPVYAWVVGRMVQRGLLTVDQVMDIFRAEMLSPEQSSAAVSVAAAFILEMMVQNRSEKCPVTAKHFVDVKVLCEKKSNHRDEIVGQIMLELNNGLGICQDEQEKLAAEVLGRFPNGSPLAGELFIMASKREAFVNGWLRAHKTEKYHAVSSFYLRHLSGKLDESVLSKFPMRGARLSEEQVLVVRKRKLRNTSIRFLVIVLLVAILYWLNKFYNEQQ